MGLTIDEHRDLVNCSLLELRAALKELAELLGIHVSATTPALFAAIEAPNSAIGQLVRFTAEVEAGRRYDPGLERQRVLEADWRRAAEEARARQERDAVARAEFVRVHPRPPGAFPMGQVPGNQRGHAECIVLQ